MTTSYLPFWAVNQPYGVFSQWALHPFDMPVTAFVTAGIILSEATTSALCAAARDAGRLTEDGRSIRFNCAEQAMMCAKALCFRDLSAATAALKTNNPRKQKTVGRTVANYDDAAWGAVRLPVVTEISYYKFAASEDMRRLLLDTGDAVLVEASPEDRVWGIGLPPDDPRVHIPDQWQGTNLLGIALGKARARLAAEQVVA